MKNKIKWIFSFVALSLVMALTCWVVGNLHRIHSDSSTVALVKENRPVDIVIDAGHGGEDGGCSATDGTLEKDLNLTVSNSLYTVLTLMGMNVEMTRTEDTLLYDMYKDLSDYSGQKKTYDLKNRVRFAKESECALFCSIHMNKFSQSEYSGLQVYFSPNDSDSVTAALRIQAAVSDHLQKDNEREIKRAGSNIYVLHRSQMPSVLVECGFLSNEKDLSDLKNEKYRKKLAFTVASSMLEAISEFER